MFDRATLLAPSRTVAPGTCTLQCPWCSVLLRTQSQGEVSRGEPTLRPDAERRLLLTIVEAAHALGLGRSKMYALAAAGELPVIHFGRSVRIPIDALEGWISANMSAPVPNDDRVRG